MELNSEEEYIIRDALVFYAAHLNNVLISTESEQSYKSSSKRKLERVVEVITKVDKT